MGEIDNDAEPFTFANNIATKRRQSFRRRAGRREDAAVTSGVRARVSQSNCTQAQFIKRPQQIQIVSERLDTFHGDKKSDLSGIECARNFVVAATNYAAF